MQAGFPFFYSRETIKAPSSKTLGPKQNADSQKISIYIFSSLHPIWRHYFKTWGPFGKSRDHWPPSLWEFRSMKDWILIYNVMSVNPCFSNELQALCVMNDRTSIFNLHEYIIRYFIEFKEFPNRCGYIFQVICMRNIISGVFFYKKVVWAKPRFKPMVLES